MDSFYGRGFSILALCMTAKSGGFVTPIPGVYHGMAVPKNPFLLKPLRLGKQQGAC